MADPLPLGIASIQNGEAVTTSLAIAVGTQNDHATVIKLVRNHQADLEEFGLLDFKSRSSGGRHTEFAILNEQQATLLITYMRNSEVVRAFKKALVRAFFELREQLVPPPARSWEPAPDEELEALQRQVSILRTKITIITLQAQLKERLAPVVELAPAQVRIEEEIARLLFAALAGAPRRECTIGELAALAREHRLGVLIRLTALPEGKPAFAAHVKLGRLLSTRPRHVFPLADGAYATIVATSRGRARRYLLTRHTVPYISGEVHA